MKTTDKNSAAAAARAGKQKKQALALGGLVVVLAIVLFVQFGGNSPEGEAVAQAMEQPTVDASGAPVASPDPAATAAPVAAAPVSMEAPSDNAVLIKPVDGGLVRSPFTNFWNPTARAGAPKATPEMAAPTVTLSATMPSAVRPMAIIDGQLHYVGDMIGGWVLTDVQARSISLRSPTKAVMTVDMPVLSGPVRR